ncbi:MAG: alpha-galactosidase [Clostridia bacterium]|nr:alpha-galactosidase [Clostridia bacterium]
MKKFIITYKCGSQIVTSSEKENSFYSLDITDTAERFTVVLKPKKTFELVDFDVEMSYEFSEGDKFFCAGYQSWTLTKERTKNDIQKGTIKLANIHKKVKHIASMTCDERMVEYTGIPGEFHSHGYTYIRNGESMKLWGSLCEETGYTLFKVKMNDNRFIYHKDVLGKFVTEDYKVFDIVYFEGGYDEVFDKYFGMFKMPETRKGMMSGYTSWYNYFQNINEEIILRDLNGLDPVKEDVSIFQIDDGYETFVGDWLDPNPARFPNGMGYIADKIHEKGYKAGIWLAPFSCQKVSRTAKEHPEWLIKDENGKPLQGVLAWGGAYILDIYNEGARNYLKEVFDTVLNVWGYDMVKLDFLYSQCIYPRNGKCRGEIMRDAMLFLRELVGDKLLLGCGVPMSACFGLVDACRISCDVDLTYKGKIYNFLEVSPEILSAQSAINNSIFRRHLNGRVFMNDPDVFFLRNNNLKFTEEQKLLLAKINNLFGNVLFVSDDAGDYDEKQMDYLRKFFKKTDEKVIMAEYTDDENISIITELDGKQKEFSFNIKKGTVTKQ